jgi:DNA-directed RNA polymerase beta subunit
MLETINVPIKQSQKEDLDILFNPIVQGMTPFAGTVESSRLNMAAKYLNQCVPGLDSDNPFIVSQDSFKIANITDHFKMYAQEDILILYKGNNVIVFYKKESKEIDTYYLPEYMDAASSSYKLYYFNKERNISKGDLIYSYAPIDTDSLIPKLGYRVNVAFTPFFGFTTEDSYAISERFAKRARILKHEKIFIPITFQFRYFKRFKQFLPEIGQYIDAKTGLIAYQNIEQNRNIFNDVSNISPKESKIFSKTISPKFSGIVSAVKVHKLAKNEKKLSIEKITNRELYDELENQFNTQYGQVMTDLEDNLKLIPDEDIRKKLIAGITNAHIFISKLTKADLTNKFKQVVEDVELKEIDYIIEIDIASNIRTQYGDKFTTMYAGKGTVGVIVPDEVMPTGANGEKIDVFMNPISIFGRNNWGIIYETVTSKIIQDVEKCITSNDIDGTLDRLRFIAENYSLKDTPELYDDIQTGLNGLRDNWETFKATVIKNGFFLITKLFSEFTYKEYIEQFIAKYEKQFNISITAKDKLVYSKKMFEWLKSIDLDSGVLDIPETDISVDVFQGKCYMMKLYHTSESKYNMTNIVGRYTASGQPARGKSNEGAPHCSWQTLSALLASGATDVLKELYTVKSDSLASKEQFLSQMISDKKYFLKHKYDSKTKATIDIYLQMLGLKFDD